MRIRTSLLTLGLTLGALAAAPAFAAGATAATAKPMTSQQNRMASCSHQSKGMKGEAHKKFMSECLHGKTTAAKPTQQEKMKTCNADAKAKGLKGAARKGFMSSCLKNH